MWASHVPSQNGEPGNSTVNKMLALCMADPGLIPGTTYSPLSSARSCPRTPLGMTLKIKKNSLLMMLMRKRVSGGMGR